ncbi:LysM peptidoglycan-binding domain-containing protein [Agromyces sp. MMS24-JH15]|uniref:lytic transglycosylase n=1 Tax=Agromyces sp. MMS24-JH15 TaxID=3243765 RepID=UPI00374A53A1
MTHEEQGSDPMRRGDRTRRRGPFLRVLAAPAAIVGTVAISLGIVAPADASPAPSKRSQRPPAQAAGSRTLARPASVPAAPSEYTVVEGDTVSGVAERFGLATAEVLALNGLSWSTLIFPGQRLRLPSGPAAPAPAPVEIRRHVVVEGDTVSAIAAANGLDLAAVLSANGLGRASLIFPGEQLVLPPGGAVVPPPAEAEAPTAPEASTAPSAPGPDASGADAPVEAQLTDEMRANARIVVDVGRSLGVPERAILIALVAAAQESGLRNAPTGDQDSLGLFQQRPSQGWGTPAEVLDPVRSATAFYGGDANPNPGLTRGILDIPDWEALPVGAAAQAVQISAHPDAYAKWEAPAAAWLAELG